MENGRLEQDIRTLKEWYEKQPHLPKDISENYFHTFAIGCKSLEIAKKKMDTFFSQRNNQVWFYDFESLFQRFKEETGGDYFFLPGKTPEGWRVMVISFQLVDINKTNPRMEIFRRMLLLELGIYLWPTDTKLAFVFDVKGGGVKYYTSLDIPSEINFSKFIQSAMPLSMKCSLLLNSSPIFEKTMELFRPFVSKKIFDRAQFCTGTSRMAEVFPLSMVPNEYGGTAGSIADLGASWRKKMLEKEDWFRANSKLRSDESKRPKDSGQSLDCGTFRSLTID